MEVPLFSLYQVLWSVFNLAKLSFFLRILESVDIYVYIAFCM